MHLFPTPSGAQPPRCAYQPSSPPQHTVGATGKGKFSFCLKKKKNLIFVLTAYSFTMLLFKSTSLPHQKQEDRENNSEIPRQSWASSPGTPLLPAIHPQPLWLCGDPLLHTSNPSPCQHRLHKSSFSSGAQQAPGFSPRSHRRWELHPPLCFSPAKSSSPPETSPCLPWAYRLQTELKKRCISAGFASKIKTQIMKQTVSHHKLTAWKAFFKRKSIHFNFYTHASYVNRTSGELMACLLKRPITSASFVLHRGKSKHAAPMCVTPVKAKSKRD